MQEEDRLEKEVTDDLNRIIKELEIIDDKVSSACDYYHAYMNVAIDVLVKARDNIYS